MGVNGNGNGLTPDTKVRISARELLAGIGAIIVGAIAIGGAWFTFNTHATDVVKHLDPEKVAERGGPVLREDLREAQRAISNQLVETESRIVRTVRETTQAPIQLRGCRPGAGGSVTCRMEVER